MERQPAVGNERDADDDVTCSGTCSARRAATGRPEQDYEEWCHDDRLDMKRMYSTIPAVTVH